VEVISNVEAGVRHHDATDQRRDRRLAVERMGPMDDEAGFDRPLAGLFRIERRREVAYWHGRAAPAARHYSSAGRGWIHVHTAGHLERLHERAQADFVIGFHNEVELFSFAMTASPWIRTPCLLTLGRLK
jgi:hypothetical protein